jgi:hypothetical protein
VVALAQRLRARRGLYLALLAACFASALFVPVSMQWLEHALGAQRGWESVAGFARLHAQFGTPWWLLAWGFPVAYAGAIALLLWLFEALVVALRFDPRDVSATSIRWALRGWAPALVVTIAFVVLTASALGLRMLLGGGMPDASEGYVLPLLLLPFFAWNPELASAPKPAFAGLRPRWPGTLAVVVAAGAAATLWLGAGAFEKARESAPVVAALGIVALLVAFIASIVVQLLWLRRGDSPRATLVAAGAPRVVLPMLVFYARAIALMLSLLLPLLPLALQLLYLTPSLWGQIGYAPAGSADTAVSLSRFALSYWWLVVLLVLGPTQWLWMAGVSPAGSARLLYLLGLLPAGEPSGLRSRK